MRARARAVVHVRACMEPIRGPSYSEWQNVRCGTTKLALLSKHNQSKYIGGKGAKLLRSMADKWVLLGSKLCQSLHTACGVVFYIYGIAT